MIYVNTTILEIYITFSDFLRCSSFQSQFSMEVGTKLNIITNKISAQTKQTGPGPVPAEQSAIDVKICHVIFIERLKK